IIAECNENDAEFLGLTLYGGEPLLNLGVMRYVVDRLRRWSAAEGVAFDANLITNGTRARKEDIAPLLPSLKTVQLTLDGAREHHDRIRIDGSGQGTFDRVLDGAEHFLALGVRVMFRIQLTPEAYDTIDDCLRQLQARNLLNRPDIGLYFFPIMDVGGVCSAKSFSCYKQYFSQPLIERLGKVAEGFHLQPFRLPRPVWQQPYCSFVNRHAWLIDPKGDCYKCVSMIGHPEYRAGSVWSHEQAGQSAEFQAVADTFVQRSGAAIEACHDCEFLPSCDGGCAYRALVTTGDMAQPCCEMHGEAQRAQIRATYRACGRGDG
ncbi:MAG: SPASM domain-containing protein, partial [Candidatus Thiodiazotropha sp.]